MGRGTKAPEGITFDQIQAWQERVTNIVRQNPNVAAAMSSAGQGGGGTIGPIRLKPQQERTADAKEIVQQCVRP